MAGKKATKKMGRPPLPPGERRRASMGFRPTPAIRRELEQTAFANGRSLSQEIEARLELSFAVEKTRIEAFGGDATDAVTKALAAAANAVSQKAKRSWLEDAGVYREVEKAIFLLLDAFRPGKKGSFPLFGLGVEVAADILRKQADRIDRRYTEEIDQEIIDRLDKLLRK